MQKIILANIKIVVLETAKRYRLRVSSYIGNYQRKNILPKLLSVLYTNDRPLFFVYLICVVCGIVSNKNEVTRSYKKKRKRKRGGCFVIHGQRGSINEKQEDVFDNCYCETLKFMQKVEFSKRGKTRKQYI